MDAAPARSAGRALLRGAGHGLVRRRRLLGPRPRGRPARRPPGPQGPALARPSRPSCSSSPGSATPRAPSAAELSEALTRLRPWTDWPGDYDGTFAAQAALKNTTSSLIGRFCQSAAAATREAPPGGRQQAVAALTRYAADLVVPRETRLECALLKAITARYVMARDDARERRRLQRELVTGLVEGLSALPEHLEPSFRTWYADAADDSTRLRVIVDQVASLTDDAAYALSRRLGTV